MSETQADYIGPDTEWECPIALCTETGVSADALHFHLNIEHSRE